MMRYILSLLLMIALGITAWVYYPQYQIYKMKKQSIKVHSLDEKISYLEYYRNNGDNELYHLALGDSIIRGVGAEKDENLVYQFSNKLGEQIHKKIEFKNEGKTGITSGELKELVDSGQFDEEIKKANIITINVGGNDILRIAKSENFYTAIQTFDQLQEMFSKNLAQIIARINTLNPNATIVFLELYNPLSPDEQVYPLANKLLPKWNVKIYEIAKQSPSSIVVETTKVMNGENRQNLSPDGVHPNREGYKAISEEMINQFKHQYRKKEI